MPVPQNAMKDVQHIVKGISRFIKYWEKLCNADVTGESRRRYEHLVHYWRDVKIALEEPLPNPTVLKDDFWPTTRVEGNEEDQLDEDGVDLEEFGEDDAYMGPLRNRPQPSFRVWLEMFLKAILLQSGLQMGTLTQFELEEHCPIQTQALKILIASSFNTSVQHQGMRMCKTSTLDGTTKEVYVGE